MQTSGWRTCPAATRDRAAFLLLDGIGCALVGAQLPWSRRAVQSVCRLEGEGPAALIGWNRSVPPPAAALLNSTFVQGFELDDFHPYAPLHSASLVLPALLAAAQATNRPATATPGPVSGAAFLRAAIAGFEVGPRAGLALHGGIEMLTRGWHSGAVFGTHAAAAAVGTLFGLDAAGFEDALGLAGTQSGGLMGAQFEAMSKRMHHGFASRAGLYAAWLAADGYTGIKRVFERSYGGFLSVFGEGHAPDAGCITEALGERWETNRIVVKIHATMGGVQSTVDGLAALQQRCPFRPDEIERIDIGVSHAVLHHGGFPVERPLTPIGAQMSLIYTAAAAAIDGAAGVAQYNAGRIGADDIWSLIPRVHTHEEEALNTAEDRAAVQLRVSLKDGTVHDIRQKLRLSPDISNADITAKFTSMTDGSSCPTGATASWRPCPALSRRMTCRSCSACSRAQRNRPSAPSKTDKPGRHPRPEVEATTMTTKWRVIGLLFLLQLVNYVDRANISVAGPSILRELHLNAADFGWVLAAFSLGYTLCQIRAACWPIGSGRG